MVISDEELQQDVEGAREDAVGHGHGDPHQAAAEHLHDAATRRRRPPIGHRRSEGPRGEGAPDRGPRPRKELLRADKAERRVPVQLPSEVKN